jgi:uncharacterized membrane protein YeaQ/YmgE (transglycosylase-associated protein family)
MLFASFGLSPQSIAAWLCIGVAVGWLAGKVMEYPTYGIIGDLVLGAIGAVVGGGVLGFFIESEFLFWIALVTALVGACVLVGVGRAVAARLNA